MNKINFYFKNKQYFKILEKLKKKFFSDNMINFKYYSVFEVPKQRLHLELHWFVIIANRAIPKDFII
jgi:hypothetical protein